MSGRKYEVLDEFNHVLASNMELSIAICFIRGYCDYFYNEKLDLRLREMDRIEGTINE